MKRDYETELRIRTVQVLRELRDLAAVQRSKGERQKPNDWAFCLGMILGSALPGPIFGERVRFLGLTPLTLKREVRRCGLDLSNDELRQIVDWVEGYVGMWGHDRLDSQRSMIARKLEITQDEKKAARAKHLGYSRKAAVTKERRRKSKAKTPPKRSLKAGWDALPYLLTMEATATWAGVKIAK